MSSPQNDLSPPPVSTIGLPKPRPGTGDGWSIDGYSSPADEPIDREVLDNPATSVGAMVLRRAAATPDRPAWRFRDAVDEWTEVTWGQFRDIVEEHSAGLLAAGLRKGDAAALIAGTSMPWVNSDMALMSIGVNSVAIYPTSVPGDIEFIINDSDARMVIAEDGDQVAKLLDIRASIPKIEHVYVIDDSWSAQAQSVNSPSGTSVEEITDWVSPLSDLMDQGRELLAADPHVVRRAIDEVTPETIATFQYTSGTTGKPKGAIIPHGAWMNNVASVTSTPSLYEKDLHFLWLPLAHLMGRFLLYISINTGTLTAIDGRIDKIVENLQDIKPTVMGGAPRIFEKAYSAIQAQFEGNGVKAKLGKVSMALAMEATELRLAGKEVPKWLQFRLGIADKVVLSKIRAALGGNVRMLISGSAPINQDITKWYLSVGMPIAEGFGLTEGCITHLTRLEAYRIGTIGWPFPGVEDKIAEDGELLIKSAWNMSGYHNREDATAESLPGDGFLRTGDIARIDENSFVYITDRKKSLYKSSNGKYIAPAAIESEFKGLCPLAMELVTYGEGKKFMVGMVVLEEKATREWCERNGCASESFADMTRDPKVIAYVQASLGRLNAGLNSWEQVKRFRILDRELTVEGDELTPSLKLRRKHVHEQMKDKFEQLYADPLAKGCFDSAGAKWVSFEQPALHEHPVLAEGQDIPLPPAPGRRRGGGAR